MYVPDDAPPFLYFRGPYGGLGLKTKSATGARAKIDGLLAAMAAEESLHLVELTVLEPATRALVEGLVGTFGPNTAFVGGGSTRDDLAAASATAGYTNDELAGEAWRRFGAPNAIMGAQQQGAFHVGWRWHVTDTGARADTAAHLDACFPFLAAHDQLMQDGHSTRVEIRAIWRFRLRSTTGTIAAAPYPESEITAQLRGRHASAFIDVVFPHTALTPVFFADHDAVCKAMNLTLSIKSFRLNAPKKRGAGRVHSKI